MTYSFSADGSSAVGNPLDLLIDDPPRPLPVLYVQYDGIWKPCQEAERDVYLTGCWRSPTSYRFFSRGLLHCDDGRAAVMHVNDLFVYREWYIHGKRVLVTAVLKQRDGHDRRRLYVIEDYDHVASLLPNLVTRPEIARQLRRDIAERTCGQSELSQGVSDV
jgi:hypothetical protein